MYQASKDAWRMWISWLWLRSHPHSKTKPLAKYLDLHSRTTATLVMTMVRARYVKAGEGWTWTALEPGPPEVQEPIPTAKVLRERATRKAAQRRRAEGKALMPPLPVVKHYPVTIPELDRVWPDPYYNPTRIYLGSFNGHDSLWMEATDAPSASE